MPEPKIRNRPTPEGADLGRQIAALCDEAEPKARLEVPEIPPRCQSCAFREGRHAANGSPQTQADAVQCLLMDEPFYCHQPDREGHPCSGWAMLKLGFEGGELYQRLRPIVLEHFPKIAESLPEGATAPAPNGGAG